MTRKFPGLVAVASMILASTALIGASPAQADVAAEPTPSYVALGDSYASGTGTRTYLRDGTSCQRSVYAYPSLIAAASGYALNFRACSGATVPDVTSSQLGALNPETDYVSISVGGNDAGFADVLVECALPGWFSNCNGAINTAVGFINNTLPARLGTLYSSIRTRSPGAQVVVVGYPRIFNGEDCNALTWFSPKEEARLNATADLLNSRTSSQASAKGFAFADPTGPFLGHAVCDNPEYLNGLSYPVSNSYHPNRSGHSAGYTPVVSPLLTGSALRVTPAVRAMARAGARAQTRLQKTYAATDRSIVPESFVAPNLDSPRARSAARRAGVDLTSARWSAVR